MYFIVWDTSAYAVLINYSKFQLVINAKPHRARIVSDYLRKEVTDTIPWPPMSPDLNPIEHVWDDIGRKSNNRIPASKR